MSKPMWSMMAPSRSSWADRFSATVAGLLSTHLTRISFGSMIRRLRNELRYPPSHVSHLSLGSLPSHPNNKRGRTHCDKPPFSSYYHLHHPLSLNVSVIRDDSPPLPLPYPQASHIVAQSCSPTRAHCTLSLLLAPSLQSLISIYSHSLLPKLQKHRKTLSHIQKHLIVVAKPQKHHFRHTCLLSPYGRFSPSRTLNHRIPRALYYT